MRELQRVADLVNAFFQQALAEEIAIALQSIKFLREAVRGNDSARAANLRFAENEGEDRNVEVTLGDGEQAPGFWSDQRLHARQHFRRVVLLALGMEGELGVERVAEQFARH